MVLKKGRAFPIIITVILIIIIVYLFANIKQPYVECSNTTTNSLGIEITENIKVDLSNNNIRKMDLTKTIVLPENYLTEEKNYLSTLNYALENSYEKKKKKTVELNQESDRVIAHITVEDDETVILNNIEFIDGDSGLQIMINANTKAPDVVTLQVGDSYTEGEFMTHMKNNGYSCK